MKILFVTCGRGHVSTGIAEAHELPRVLIRLANNLRAGVQLPAATQSDDASAAKSVVGIIESIEKASRGSQIKAG